MSRLQVVCLSFVAAAIAPIWLAAASDETSTGDKLRILYSNRFTFTDDGTPLVTVELMSSQSRISLSAKSGIIVRPDGEGSSEVVSGGQWEISLQGSSPAVIREWTVVESFEPSDDAGAARSLQHWQSLGYKGFIFETGTVFGVQGEVIDTRESLVAISPTAPPNGAATAEKIAKKFDIKTRVYTEMVRRPQGTIIAKNSTAVVRNPSVIWFAPQDPNDLIMVKDVIVGAGGSQLTTTREDRHYFGSIYVTIGSDGKLVAANAVPADKLLAGLVPSEMYPDAPAAALAAQAIAARTELLQKIGTRHLTDPYLLCSNQHCQVYSGAGREHPRTTSAVKETRGLVLVREGGGLVDARYSASCGGHGEHNENIWDDPPDPTLRGHLDTKSSQSSLKAFAGGVKEATIHDFLAAPSNLSYCAATRYSKGRYRWNMRLDVAQLSANVAAQYPHIGTVRALIPLERGISGRIRSLEIRGSKGNAVIRGDLHIRRLLGGLRSSLFIVSPIGDSNSPSAFEFRGAGFGHGVGMCQLGAIGMAEQGHSYTEILKHYYSGSHIKRLY